MAAVPACRVLTGVVGACPSAANVLSVALGAAVGGASRHVAAAMVAAAARTSHMESDDIKTEVAARFAMVEPALTNLF